MLRHQCSDFGVVTWTAHAHAGTQACALTPEASCGLFYRMGDLSSGCWEGEERSPPSLPSQWHPWGGGGGGFPLALEQDFLFP